MMPSIPKLYSTENIPVEEKILYAKYFKVASV